MRLAAMMVGLIAWSLMAAPARAQSVDNALASLRVSAAAVAARSRKEPGVIPPSLAASLESNVARIRNSAASIPAAARRAYASSLREQARLLDKGVAEPDPATALALVTDASSDLALKAQARLAGAANALRGHIRVSIATRKNGREVPGLTVGANPLSFSGSPDIMFRFDRMSSPTVRDLPPGRYEFVLMRGNAVISRQRGDVGLTSSAAQAIDLSVP